MKWMIKYEMDDKKAKIIIKNVKEIKKINEEVKD
jgi:hypothetical protein